MSYFSNAALIWASSSPLLIECLKDLSHQIRQYHVARRFQAVLTVAGLPRFTVYTLRHTYASHPLAMGAPITYVAAQLGHAKPTTTLAFFAHWMPKDTHGLAAKLEMVRTAAVHAPVATL